MKIQHTRKFNQKWENWDNVIETGNNGKMNKFTYLLGNNKKY